MAIFGQGYWDNSVSLMKTAMNRCKLEDKGKIRKCFAMASNGKDLQLIIPQ